MSGSNEVTLNDRQKVFVIRQAGGGYSCFGYRNCFEESTQLADRLGRPDLAPDRERHFGTIEGYSLNTHLLGLARNKDLGTWFTPGTPKAVQDILERARLSGERLRLTLGDRESGRAWGDRPQTGAISRSGGSMKVPILVANRRSHGGGAILTDCIVAIETSRGGTRLYAHPNLHTGPAREAQAEPESAAPAP